MTFIKFCGMTREMDVETAVELQVDAIGLVLWEGSPRHVTLDRARALVAALPADVIPVGVFVRPNPSDVARAVREAGIRVAQIHGTDGNGLGEVDCEMWLASSLSGASLSPPVPDGCTVLLDTADPMRHGGTGRTIDWGAAARIAAARKVLLAGGLTPANVVRAVRQVRPFGVDVASGIEERPGIKNAEAMRRFVAAVREADR